MTTVEQIGKELIIPFDSPEGENDYRLQCCACGNTKFIMTPDCKLIACSNLECRAVMLRRQDTEGGVKWVV